MDPMHHLNPDEEPSLFDALLTLIGIILVSFVGIVAVILILAVLVVGVGL